jgi:hypothetical protein
MFQNAKILNIPPSPMIRTMKIMQKPPPPNLNQGRRPPERFLNNLWNREGIHDLGRLPITEGGGPQTKEQVSRKAARAGEQHVVWKALDLVSSFPFSREIEMTDLPERFKAPRFKAYND